MLYLSGRVFRLYIGESMSPAIVAHQQGITLGKVTRILGIGHYLYQSSVAIL